MFRAKGSTRAVLGGLRWPRQIAGKHAAQPRFLNTAGASLTKQSLKEESGFSNENRAISGELATVPLTKDERPWIRWPVSAFMILVYRPLLKPLGLFFSDPKFFVFFLMTFLFVGLPLMITSGFLTRLFGPAKSPQVIPTR